MKLNYNNNFSDYALCFGVVTAFICGCIGSVTSLPMLFFSVLLYALYVMFVYAIYRFIWKGVSYAYNRFIKNIHKAFERLRKNKN